MKSNLRIVTLAGLLALSGPAAAEDIDVGAAEYIDVVETTDGSVWKGILIEQTPNVQYKIAIAGGSVHVIKAADVVKLTRQRNQQRAVAPANTTARPLGHGQGLQGRYDRPSSLPAPMAKSGMRFEPELVFVFPRGVLADEFKLPTSFAPGFRVGYEHLFGNFGLSGGGQARFTYWQLPGDTEDSLWTLETMLYARAALHLSRAVPYAGMSLGLDTNYIWDGTAMRSNTSVGFGMNLQAGINVVATPSLSLDLGVDLHPGTDTLSDLAMENQSVSYWGLRVGAAMRF